MDTDLSIVTPSPDRGIVIHVPSLPTQADVDLMNNMCKIVAYSGLLSSTSDKLAQRAADAFFVMALGREIGIPAITALRLIYVIDGKPSMSGQGMLGLLRKAGFKVVMPNPGKVTNEATVQITRPGEEPHEYTYTTEMANKAGLLGKKNWKSHPAEMLCWRALATGAKMEGSDIINGMHMVEEIAPDIEVDEMGAPVQSIKPTIIKENGEGFTPPSPAPTEDPVTDGEIIDPPKAEGSGPAAQQEGQGQEQGGKGEGDDAGQGAGAAAATTTTAKSSWANKKTIPTLLKTMRDKLNVDNGQISKLTEITELNNAAVWNEKYATGQEAFDALKVAVQAARANPSGAPSNTPAVDRPADTKAPATAPANMSHHQWTKVELENMDDRCAGWYDTVQKFPMMSDSFLAGLNQVGWSTYRSTGEAENSIIAYAKEHQIPMIASKARYMGQYTEFFNSFNQFSARLYGTRDLLRQWGPDWSAFVDTWEDGKTYDLAAQDREIVLDWEQENGYVKASNPQALATVKF